MKWFKNLKVAAKLMVSFAIVILLAAVIGVVGIIGMVDLQEGASRIDDDLLAIEALANIRERLGVQRNDIRNIFLSQDNPDKIHSLIEDIAESDRFVDENIAVYESLIEDRSAETAFLTALDAWEGPFAQMKANMWVMIDRGDFEGAYDLFDSQVTLIATITNGLAAAAAFNDEAAKAQNAENDAMFRRLLTIIIVLIAAVLIISLFITFYISGAISKPLSVLSGFMTRAGGTGDIVIRPADMKIIEEYSKYRDETGRCIAGAASFIEHVTNIASDLQIVAGGDLTVEIELLSDDDTMGKSLKHMIENLGHMFGEIHVSTAQVSTGTKQIADGAQSLAQGTTEQAASVEQLSSSISEIAQKTKENAGMAMHAATLANTIKQNAEKGSFQMDEMMAAVREINQASESISKVIKVIDDIAFQTNILALNAAVEAARAGQHGKGFAVVAEEVRNLAAKSAEAAKDTGELIANSIEKAELGSRIANDTAASLTEIVTGINESSRIVEDIASSSEQQSIGIVHINQGIDQVAQVVQQNSATAEQSAAASEEMSSQSDMLENLISNFKVKEDYLLYHSLKADEKPQQKRLGQHVEP